ncbi:MAG: hypothetical protein IKS04_00515 [Clostridia bacterium]|nr:hypothetical protein [Clostridia bacterium]
MAKRRRKNRAALPVGIIVIIFALIGLAASISATVKFVKAKADDTAAKARYEEMLKPVVMFDPDPFDDLTQANKSQLLYSAIWSLLSDEAGMSKYPYSQGETIGILVPQADIEKAFTGLYGNEIDLASLHSSIDMSGYDITYDAAQKSYILPITGVEAIYTPQVIGIDKQGTSVILNVGYIANKAWADIDDGGYTAPEPDKYMKITLRERNGDIYVSSIQAADNQEIAKQLKSTTQIVTEPPATTQETTVPEEITDESESETELQTDEYGNPVTQENPEDSTDITGESSPETETTTSYYGF